MLKTAIYLIGLLVLLVLYARYIERTALFSPEKVLKGTPALFNLSFEDIFFQTPDGMLLHSWFIPCEGAEKTVLLFHGNGGNISHRLDKLRIVHGLGVNIFIIDYRGYGKSQGEPSEQGVYIDARAAYDFLIQERALAPSDIIIYGASLGGAIAVDLASKVETAGLILEATFSSAKDMARRFYPLVPAFFFTDLFNSIAKITDVGVSKLFIHSPADDVVPIALAEKLYLAASEPKVFVRISGPHGVGFLDSRQTYTAALAQFLASLKGVACSRE